MLCFKNIVSIFCICLLFFSSCTLEKPNKDGETDKQLTLHLDSIVQFNKVFVLSSANSDQVLDLYRGSKEDNAPVNGYSFNGGPNQFWQLEKTEKGYIIRSNYSHKALTADVEYSRLVQKEYKGNDNQLWNLSGSVDSVCIVNKASHQYLTLDYDKVGFEGNPQNTTKYWNIKPLQDLMKEFGSCDCNENLQFVKHLVETSYSGFPDKVNTETKGDYNRLYQLSLEEAKKTNDPAKCFKIIRDYLLFFHDNHLQFHMNSGPFFTPEKKDYEKIRKYYAGSESVKKTDQQIKEYLKANRQSISELEGIWESLEGDYQCAIIQDSLNKDRFLGIVLKGDSSYWMPGQVKMDFRKLPDNRYLLYYAMKNHLIVEGWNTEIMGDTLYMHTGKWIKKYPKNSGGLHRKMVIAQQNATSFELKNIDDSTMYLSLPNFDYSNKSIVDDLINNNRNKLSHCPYLIIDIRGNGGGSDNTFSSILPFIYTHPFHTDGTDILSSKENIAFMEQQIIHADNSQKAWIKSFTQRMKENPGKFVARTNDQLFQYNTVLPYPRKIGILINSGCASSAEEFLLYARESEKVTLFGQPTSGTLDYSNVRKVEKCPSPSFSFYYPLTRSNRLPNYSVDKEKIKPTVYLTNDQNWVDVALRQLKYKQ